LRWFGGEREQAARTFFNPQRARARETNVSWSTQFDAAIETPGGRKLVTLEDAARYIQRLAPVTRGRPEWQLAGTILIDAAEGRDFVMHVTSPAPVVAIEHDQRAPGHGAVDPSGC
jgi:hypothetical protein